MKYFARSLNQAPIKRQLPYCCRKAASNVISPRRQLAPAAASASERWASRRRPDQLARMRQGVTSSQKRVGVTALPRDTSRAVTSFPVTRRLGVKNSCRQANNSHTHICVAVICLCVSYLCLSIAWLPHQTLVLLYTFYLHATYRTVHYQLNTSLLSLAITRPLSLTVDSHLSEFSRLPHAWVPWPMDARVCYGFGCKPALLSRRCRPHMSITQYITTHIYIG